MLINLSELLSNEGDAKVFQADIEMTVFKSGLGNYQITEKSPIELTITNIGGRKLSIVGQVRLSLNIPCDRCLEDVKTDIEFSIDKTVSADASESEGVEVEEQDFMEGYNLDVDRMIYPEILMNLPAKTLCREDCKGLCLRCGANLNVAECGCDRTSLDPRMSVIQDIFNNYKEV